MEALIGFGSPLVTVLWGLSVLVVVWWVGRQLFRRQLVTLLSNAIIFGLFLPILLQYPFAFSPINGLTIGADNYLKYRSEVDSAFLITLSGWIALVAGYFTCGRRTPHFIPMTLVWSGLRVWTQSVFLQLSSAFILVLFALLFSLGMLGPEGARNIAQTLPALRPIYNIAHVLLPLTIAIGLFVGVQRRRRFILVLAVLNVGLATLTGARAVAFGGLLLVAIVFLIHASLLQRLSIARAVMLVPIALGILILALYLGDLREGQYNLFRTVATLGIKLFYGNNFSDLRDFAWVKSSWNGEYFLGRTQLAGLLAFIPSAVSSFRAEWNWGVVTATLVGLDPLVSPGLRAGVFGEMYFNFGLPGVLLAGFLNGYLVRLVHNICLAAARTLPAYEARFEVLAGLVTLNLIGGLLNTAGFFSVYITVAVLGGLQVLDYLVRGVRTGAATALTRSSVGDASTS
ncbi:MAG TPA: hypothetical protein VJ808_06035 [Gemmatimonadales bacterium]|nr:hypothetical protein [Gemmatimonadales bacterium]